MFYRQAVIHARKAYTADTTEIIDLDVADPISALVIELAVANVGSIAPTAHAIACLTKIELVDGSNVLFSLNGYEAEAADWYHNLVQRSNWNPYLDGMEVQRFIGINFGRYLWDPLLALDPKRFTNLQLKLSLDINGGGNNPVTNRLQVFGLLFDEKKISPVGFLMHKELKSYAMGSASHEYTDLPTDYPYRKLFIRSQTAGTEPGQIVDKIKLSEDRDKRVIFEEQPDNLLRAIAARSPSYHEEIIGYAGTASTNGFCTPTTRVYGGVHKWALTTGAGEISFYDGDGGRFKVIAATAASNVQVLVAGWAPHGTWEIPFGDQSEPNDWYDVSKIGNLKLDVLSVSGASSSNSTQIFAQQFRKY